MSTALSTCTTRQRILEAAGELFADQGYQNASVREICARARANHAAVNYHFGDKERLYAEVLFYANRCASEQYPADEGLPESATAEEKLRAFVHSTLMRILDEGRQAWHGKLILREMVEPTKALEALVREESYPRAQKLERIVRELLGEGADSQQIYLCMMSVLGQCAFHRNAAPYIARIAPMLGWTKRTIEDLTDHITRFSLEAIRGLAAEQEALRARL